MRHFGNGGFIHKVYMTLPWDEWQMLVFSGWSLHHWNTFDW